MISDEIKTKEEQFEKPTNKKGDKKQSKDTKSEQKAKSIAGKFSFLTLNVPVNVPDDKLCLIKEVIKIEHIDSFKGKDKEGNVFSRQMKKVIFKGIVDNSQHTYQIMLSMKNFSKFVEIGTEAELKGKSICILPKQANNDGETKYSSREFQLVENSQELL